MKTKTTQRTCNSRCKPSQKTPPPLQPSLHPEAPTSLAIISSENDAKIASDIISPEFSGTLTLSSMFATEMQHTDMTATGIASALSAECDTVSKGDLTPIERRLTTQGATLDRLFHHLTQIALNGKLPHDLFERYMRLAFKAQAQSSNTLEALATIKQGPRIVIAKQANVAQQQVINQHATHE